ncbi:MAG: Matrixin [Isosphaeraceae bacterium]|nr:Matrixin [Isosphaeraceae bacterium]
MIGCCYLRFYRFWAACVLVFALVPDPIVHGEEAPPDVTTTPPYDDFYVIPLRVHVLTSKELSDVDCRLSDSDVSRVLSKVNAIWHRAGIHWGLESLRREPAAREPRFKLARDLDGPGNLGLFRLLMPEESRHFAGLHVYYIHKFAVNGVWLGEGIAFVQETAALRPVEGGIDEPLPRVTAHELGHGLGLSHRQDRTNLLASGTTGTLLNTEEVKTARSHAARLDGSRTVAALRAAAEEAESKQDDGQALLSWRWLAEVPGQGSDEARKNVDRLEGRRRGK